MAPPQAFSGTFETNTVPKVAAVVLVVLLTAGCISAQPYPDSWERTQAFPSNQCADISGNYYNVSDAPIGDENQFWELDDFLQWYTQSWGRPESEPVIIEIRQPDRHTITYRIRPHEPRTLEMAYGQFLCKDNAIVLRPKAEWGGSGELSGGVDSYRALLVSQDGSLVGKQTESAYGHILVLPVYSYERNWLRWKRVDKK